MNASITIEAILSLSSLGSIETFEARLLQPVNEDPGPRHFLHPIMYGMAGKAAIGGIAMFFYQ